MCYSLIPILCRLVDLLNGEQHQPWFLDLNPMHTVPTLVEPDGASLWDSHAICTYLIGKYGCANGNHALYPRDLFTRARIDQRMYTDATLAFPAIHAIVGDTFQEGGSTNVSSQQIDGAHQSYKITELLLGGKDYIAGATMTLADFSAITVITQLLTQVPIQIGDYTAMQRWIDRMESLPYFADINTKALVDFANTMETWRERNRKGIKV